MSQDTRTLIWGAQQAIKLGQKPEARHLLQQVVQQDPDNFTGWLLLASVTTNPHTALAHISRAEALNPASPTVQKAKAWAMARIPAAAPANELSANGREVWWQRPSLRWAGLATILLVVIFGSALTWWNRAGSNQETAVAQSEPAHIMVAGVDIPAFVDEQALVDGPPAAMMDEPEEETAVATPQAPAIHPKPISHQNSEPRPTWTLTPVPTPTPTPTNTPVPTFVAEQAGPVTRPFGVGPNERWVDVNLTNQTLVAYEGDTPVLTTLISSGTWQYPTVTGQFRIYLTYTSQTMDGRRLGYDYYLENVPYVMYFYKDYALHGTFWHNNFGTPMSHGCVNMRTSEAEWLYNWASIGTLVNVHY